MRSIAHGEGFSVPSGLLDPFAMAAANAASLVARVEPCAPHLFAHGFPLIRALQHACFAHLSGAGPFGGLQGRPHHSLPDNNTSPSVQRHAYPRVARVHSTIVCGGHEHFDRRVAIIRHRLSDLSSTGLRQLGGVMDVLNGFEPHLALRRGPPPGG